MVPISLIVTKFLTFEGVIAKMNISYNGNFILPKEINGTIVDKIGEYACHRGLITKLDLRNTLITQIDSNAFCLCENLSEIFLPESLIQLRDNCFAHCPIHSIFIPKNTQYITGSFNQCDKLEEIIVADENPYFLSDDGFLFSQNHKKLIRAPVMFYEIPNLSKVKSIDKYAFSATFLQTFIAPKVFSMMDELSFHCTGHLKTADFSESRITTIPPNCFFASSVEYIIFPRSLMKISDDALRKCNNIKIIDIPKRVQRIDIRAFTECFNLEYVIFHGKKDLKEVRFHSIPTFVVPDEYEDETLFSYPIIKSSFYCDYLSELYRRKAI